MGISFSSVRVWSAWTKHHHPFIQRSEFSLARMMTPPGAEKVVVPMLYRCPISLELMKDPVTLCTGQTYDRASIEQWLEAGNTTCPATMQQLETLDIVPNHTLRRLIEEWCAKHSFSLVRVSPPKPFLDPKAVATLVQEVSQAVDPLPALQKVRNLVRDGERSRRCVRDCGGVPALVSLLSNQENQDDQETVSGSVSSTMAAEEALAILAALAPVCDNELIQNSLVSGSEVATSLALFICTGSLDAKVNAARIVAAILEADCEIQFSKEEGPKVFESLGKMLREDLYPKAIKASLKVLLDLCKFEWNRDLVVAAGITAPLIELLPELQKSNAEQALGILELLSTTVRGSAAIADHDLAMAVFVSQFHTISILATEHIVSILWSLCKASRDSIVAAQQAGMFAPLLLLLQVDCAPRTRQKCSELLKQMKSSWNDHASCCAQHNFFLPPLTPL